MNSFKRARRNIKSVVEGVISTTEDKLNVCSVCQHYKPLTKRCNMCGCFMPVKAAIPIFKCPIGKW